MRRVEEIDDRVPIRTALISVYDKAGLEDFVPGLLEVVPDLRILSTGGTYGRLKQILGEDCKNLGDVSSYTGMEEAAGGLVKTIDFRLGLGYLTETYCEEHQQQMEKLGAVPIDLLVWNLYPFVAAASKEGADYEDARMNMDVGGVLANRGCGKNWLRVAAAVDPADYPGLLAELKDTKGYTTLRKRWELMQKVWNMLADDMTAVRDYHKAMPFEKAIAPYKIHNKGE